MGSSLLIASWLCSVFWLVDLQLFQTAIVQHCFFLQSAWSFLNYKVTVEELLWHGGRHGTGYLIPLELPSHVRNMNRHGPKASSQNHTTGKASAAQSTGAVWGLSFTSWCENCWGIILNLRMQRVKSCTTVMNLESQQLWKSAPSTNTLPKVSTLAMLCATWDLHETLHF